MKKIFSEVTDTYELVNHVLTLGLDASWRRKAARLGAADGGLRKKAARAGAAEAGARCLDVCTGTGEMAGYLSCLGDGTAKVVSVDFSPEMLRRALRKSEAMRISFALAEAGTLPFPDKTFDLVTISFATRNINTSRENLIDRFREFHRVLKPGGRFVNLETSQPRSDFLKKLFHIYIKLLVHPVGRAISGSRAGYFYLSKTIPAFYGAEELADTLHEAGFTDVAFQRLSLGIAAIHLAIK
ncbi:MAG: ubiquinone/menaquinone biosynthesis methyltransferase [Candidatus Eisenbacteria bacterium]|nr:ubiquinone/menaquinone biosynthesis methyltransferase [Candidatus Eisenbacteria bacterium]